MGFTTNQSSSLGDLPENVTKTLKGLGIYPPDGDALGDTPDIPDWDGATVITQGGDEHVTHEALVEMCHEDGLALTYTEPVQIPPPDDHANGEPVIFRAVVATRRGVYTAYGDAQPNDTMVDATIRMAETRAMNRAMRTAVNIGQATAAEMPGSTDGVQIE